MLEDLAAHAHQRILSNGGVTLNLQGHEPSSGYAYSPYPELERVLPASGITPQHVHQYMTDNHAALSMPGNHLGAWHDQQSGNVFLDISHVGDPTPETIAEAKKQNQLAVFDLSNFQEIPTGLERSRDVTSAWDASTFKTAINWGITPDQRSFNRYKDHKQQMKENQMAQTSDELNNIWDNAHTLGVAPTAIHINHTYGPEGRSWHSRELTPDAQQSWPAYTPNLNSRLHSYGPEWMANWHQQYQQRKRQQFETDPDMMSHEYEDWTDWYAQHAHQQFDPHTAAWDWNVAEQQFMFPPKFVSDDPEGIIRATQGGYKVKPHIPVIEPPEWQWLSAAEESYFHISPRANRESILKHGLDPRRDSRDGRVYLWSNTDDGREEASNWLGANLDLWHVNGSGLPIEEWNDVLEGDYAPDRPVAYHTNRPVEPHRLTLMPSGDPWEHRSNSVPRVLFHATPSSAYHNVLQNGLISGANPDPATEPKWGVFLSPDPMEVRDYGDHVWRVNTDNLPVQPTDNTGYHYVAPHVPPHHLEFTDYGEAEPRLGAVHPEWFNEWMARNGPYIAHSTSGPETKRLIERHGLIPWDAPGMNSKYTEDMMPRPNHVYVRHPHGATEVSDKHTIYFDMRKLDPERIHADEDPFFDRHTAAKGLEPHLGHPEAIRDQSVSPSKYIGVKDRHGMYPSFGEWAEHHKLNEPAHVAHSLNDYGTLAIEGGIDPAAIVSPDEVRQWHQANGNWENNPWSGTPRIGRHNAVPYNYPHTPVVGPLVSADDRAKAQAEKDMQEIGQEPMSDFEPRLDMSQIHEPELNWSLNSSFKLTPESDASIYTREGKRLNVTNQDAGMWHVAGPNEWINNFIAPEFKPMTDKHTMPQQQTCYFHHDRPAVVEEGGAPMCHDCSERYNQAMLATRPDMRQVQPHQLASVEAWSWCSPLRHSALPHQDFMPGFYHAAPTSERARIQAHGLMPADPWHNPQYKLDERAPAGTEFGDAMRKQIDPGLYITLDPAVARAHGDSWYRGNYDLWHVPANQVQDPKTDRDYGALGLEAFHVNHPLTPTLFEGPEHRYRKPPVIPDLSWATSRVSDTCKGDEDDYVSVIGQPAYDEWQFSPGAETDEGQARLDALVDTWTDPHDHAVGRGMELPANSSLPDTNSSLPLPQPLPLAPGRPSPHAHEAGVDAIPLTELMSHLGLEYSSAPGLSVGVIPSSETPCDMGSDMGSVRDSVYDSVYDSVWHDASGIDRPSFKEFLTYASIREPGKSELDPANVFSTNRGPNMERESGSLIDGTDGWDSWEAPKTAGYPMGTGHYYHVSPRKNREAILRDGLVGSNRNTVGTPWNYSWDQPEGNYFFDNPEVAQAYAYTLKDRRGGGVGQEPAWEDMHEQPEPPEDFWDWDDEKQDEWHDENPSTERTDDPDGYDIYKVQMSGHPMMPDPETRIIGEQRGEKPWDLGRIHDYYERANQKEQDPRYRQSPEDMMKADHGEAERRYYAPMNVHPSRIQLHQHVPAFGMNSGDWEELHEEVAPDRYPQPWEHLPMTQWPMPGHESKKKKATPLSDFKWAAQWGDNDPYGALTDPEFYYHYAPTEDRERIRAHGLQPAHPGYSGHWGEVGKGIEPEAWVADQPKGIYVSTMPKHFDQNMFPGGKVDLWRIPAHQAQGVIRDPVLKQNFIIPHPVHPELHEAFEDSPRGQKHFEKQNDAWEIPEGTQLVERALYDRDKTKWGIGRPNRVVGSSNWWKPGQFGRGLISPEQDIHIWPEEEMTHAQRLNVMGVPHADQQNWERITIMPNGSVGVFHPDQANLLTQFNPKLRPGISPYVYDKVTQKAKPNPFYVKTAEWEPKFGMYPEHLVTDGAPKLPNKFKTDEEDHENSKKLHPLPEGPPVWEVPRISAADPNWLKDWIAMNGPFMVHETNPGAYHKIMREGLLPHDTISSGSIYDGHLVPRANHVYLRHPGRGGMSLTHEDNTHHVVVDLRKIDPAKLNSDEDAFMHQPAQQQHNAPLAWEEAMEDADGNPVYMNQNSMERRYQIRYGLGENDVLPSWGAYGDKFQLNEPHHVAHSFNHMGTIAHEGGIHPSAFVPMAQAHEELRNWAPPSNGSWRWPGKPGDLWTNPTIDYTDSNGDAGYGNPDAWPSEWSVATPIPHQKAASQYYYHAAPTSERARIETHGLQPAAPRLNPQWNMDDFGGKPSPGVRKQPEGVYAVDDIDRIPWYMQNSDIWRIPAHAVQNVMPDKLAPGSYVIPHAVQPELHRKYEDSEEEYIKNQDREWENGLMPDDWLWDMAGQRDYGNWAPKQFGEWGIGRGTKRGLDPV